MTIHIPVPPKRIVALGGPVTAAIRAMRADEPTTESFRAAETSELDYARIRELRRAIADRIEADIALLDALAGDVDLEDGHDAEGGTDDNGIADDDGRQEQYVGTRYAIGGAL